MEFLGRNFYMGRLMGINLYINISLPIFLFFVFISNLSSPITALFFYVLIFMFVLMHEYAHALTASMFYAYTSKIVIYMFGGAASIGPIVGNAKKLIVVLAGPASNFAMAAILSAISQYVNGGYWLQLCITINICLGIFNLIPAYPMDGGRALVAILKMMNVATKAITKIVFWTTTISCVTMIYYFGANFNTIVIAAMVWFSMFNEYKTGRFS